MARIPFAELRFFDPGETSGVLEQRLITHLTDLRERCCVPAIAAARAPDGGLVPDPLDWLTDESHAPGRTVPAREPPRLSQEDRWKIARRVKRLQMAREAASGMGQLRKEERERLAVLREGVRLVQVTSEHQADELASALHVEFPWLAPATEAVWQAMRRSVREGTPGLRLPPLLLDGPPGIGKSVWARRLADRLQTPALCYEATTENASFGIVGSQRAWGNAVPGRLIQTILQTRVGNPVVVVDEVEKAGMASSNNGQSHNLTGALLPLLEPATARRWSCPFYEVRFDMSWVIWVLTSNSCHLLPEPLLSRCPPIRLPHLSRADLQVFALREGARRGLSVISVEAITEAIDRTFTDPGQLMSLRAVLRMLDLAGDLKAKPRPQ